MIDYLNIGPTPVEEASAQVGVSGVVKARHFVNLAEMVTE